MGAREGVGEVRGQLREAGEVVPDAEVSILVGFGGGGLQVTVVGEGSLNSLGD